MMLPTIFGENLFDDFMDDALKETSSAAETRCMANTAKTL